LRLPSGTDDLTPYFFKTKKNERHLCSQCGARSVGIETQALIRNAYRVHSSCLVRDSGEQELRFAIVVANGRARQRPAFACTLQPIKSAWPNPSLKRTRTGMPLQALISFWAFHAMPARAA